MIFPEAAMLLGKDGRFATSGGWMLAAAQALVLKENVELAVATPSHLVRNLCCLNGGKIKYYLFPIGRGNERKNNDYKKYFLQIHEEFKPDVTHIHGTEYSQGLAYVEACGEKRVVVSIQGMVSVISNYYNYGLDFYDIIRNITLKDCIRGSLFSQKRSFGRRGGYEIELIKSVNHLIGRTNWDKSHIWAINPSATYHFCNESLRDEFYTGIWCYEKCIPHSIFLSQVNYPLKGFHQLLKALPLVLRNNKDVQVRIAGSDFTRRNFYSAISGYSKYITKLIKKLHLERHIVFLGPLDSNQMKKEYLSANVFVCPSSIENSSNSLGEAQLLGVPCIASYVGGGADMIPEDSCGFLYRFEEVEMLAYLICKMFDVSPIFDNKTERMVAANRHNRELNTERLLSIYDSIINLY